MCLDRNLCKTALEHLRCCLDEGRHEPEESHRVCLGSFSTIVMRCRWCGAIQVVTQDSNGRQLDCGDWGEPSGLARLLNLLRHRIVGTFSFGEMPKDECRGAISLKAAIDLIPEVPQRAGS